MYEIVDIYWERANLHLKLNKNIRGKAYLKIKSKSYELDKDKEKNEIIIKVTNTPEQEILCSGVWKVYIGKKVLTLNEEVIPLLDDKSRIFYYRSNYYSYLVSFSVDKKLNFKMRTDFMMKNQKPKLSHRLSEAKTKKKLRKIIIQKIGVQCFKFIYRIFFLFSSQKNVLFLTENAEELSGNLKYLHDYLVNNYTDYKVKVYASNRFQGKNTVFDYIKELYLLATSKAVFVDNYTPLFTHIKLSDKTRLIQLWHAGVGFKAVGYARFGLNGSPHPYSSGHRNYTHVVVDSKKLIDVYQEVFGCKKEAFIPVGIPRLDGYLTKEKIDNTLNELYEMNPKLKDNKVILFSPTFRGAGSKTAYYDYSKIDLEKIYKYCKKNKTLFVVKMHPFVRKKINIPEEYSDRIYDYSEFDINDLIYVSDIMITDYSSCAYEFSLFNRPLIFYRYDKVLYEYERPMHTVDAFTDKQYEVRTFDDLMNVLNDLNIDVADRFKNINKKRNNDSCKKIIESCLGDL